MRRLGNALATFSTRWIPDAFVFAIALTVLVYLLALGLTDHGPYQLVQDWYTGFWDLLEFGMQMTLVLVTGYALAASAPARKAITWVAALPRGPLSACAVTATGAVLLGVVHWGLGLIGGAMLAIEVARSCKRRGIKAHFPLLAAAGYAGLMIWHSGLSGSAPLLVNTEGHFLEEDIGLVGLGETLFQPFNLVFLLVMLAGIPLLVMSLHPRAEDTEEFDDSEDTGSAAPAPARTALAPAQRLMHSRIPVLLVVAAGLVYIVPELITTGVVGTDLNLLNFIFLVAGLGLHGTLANYASAAADGARTASSVIIQFPLYAGIMGIMTHAGLMELIAQWFVSLSTPLTYPFWALLSAAAVNFAVPSGGGQWAVQGPIVVSAAESLGVDVGRAVMAVAMGDQITNGIQPFWALPLLALTRLRAGQVLGYSAVVMVFAFIVAALCITFIA